jgi:type VI secretion system protein ImpC
MNEERDELQTAPDAAERRRGDDLLSRILGEGRLARDELGAAHARQMLSEFVEQIVDGRLAASDNTVAAINSRIEEIDRLISAQLNEVMHAEEFRKLEASWRGIAFLTFNTETGSMIQLRVLNVSKTELSEDLENAQGFEQSALFRRVYEQVFGVFGEVPYGALVGDYEFSNRPEDLALLKELAAVAAAAHAPFITAASPELFGWSSFKEMQNTRDLTKILDSAEYAEWRSLRESEDSKYVGLCLPHTLMRLPYGAEVQAETFHFREEVDGRSGENYLWGNAAYSFATRLTDAFAKYHWCATIRGYEGGGLVQGLPAQVFINEEGEPQVRSVTDASINDRRETELSLNGFIPLVAFKDTDYAVFLSANSCHQPKASPPTTPAASLRACPTSLPRPALPTTSSS